MRLCKARASRFQLIAQTSAVALLAVSTPAFAQSQTFDIDAMPLSCALRAFGQSSGKQIIFSDALVRGANTSGVHGAFTPEAAIGQILVHSGLTAVATPSGALMVVRSRPASAPSSALAPVAGSDALSQTDAAPPNGEIIVTATKSRQRLIDVPASITAETGAQLRQRGATQLEDIVENTPGLTNSGNGGGNNSNLVIRGVTTDTSLNLKQPSVAVLFDDIPVDPATAGLTTTNLRIVDIERVEVLRGPQGTLFWIRVAERRCPVRHQQARHDAILGVG